MTDFPKITSEVHYRVTLTAIERLRGMLAVAMEPLPPGIDPVLAQAHRDAVTSMLEELAEDVRVYRAGLIFEFLCAKYVQRSDPRQKPMGLQYTEAETHDLADEIARFIDPWLSTGKAS